MKKIYLIATLVMFGLIGHSQEISLVDSTYYNALLTSQVDNDYSLIWNNPYPSENKLDTMKISFAEPSAFTCGGTLTDTRDGQEYPTVLIGNQCWMAKNLNIGRMTYLSGSDRGYPGSYDNGIIEKFCYNNDPENCDIYGGLYEWGEMMSYRKYVKGIYPKGICPEGWHIPTDEEWCTLTSYHDATVKCTPFGRSGTDAGNKMRATGTTHWFWPNTGATNSRGFTALGAGYCLSTGNFYGLRANATFWSSSKYGDYPIYRSVLYDYAGVDRSTTNWTSGNSVRCLRDKLLY